MLLYFSFTAEAVLEAAEGVLAFSGEPGVLLSPGDSPVLWRPLPGELGVRDFLVRLMVPVEECCLLSYGVLNGAYEKLIPWSLQKAQIVPVSGSRIVE